MQKSLKQEMSSFEDRGYQTFVDGLYARVEAAYQAACKPWVVTYSGGKDSSVVLDLVLKVVNKNPDGQEIFIVSNDTRVESPLVHNHLWSMHEKISSYLEKSGISNVHTEITSPNLGNSFWVNVIGKGYPTPNRQFRWCTQKLKIDPTSKYLREVIDSSGRCTMLVGVRDSESQNRKQSIAKHLNLDSDYYSKHSDLEECEIFMPIRFLSDVDVWNYLSIEKPLWGGSYLGLINLYREAYGGECPLAVDTSQLKTASCGERSPRFGCWTCTLVKKDSSLIGLIDSGHEDLRPLYDFRNWLLEIRNDAKYRLPISRKGSVRYRSNRTIIPGPFTMEARKMIFDHLLQLQDTVNMRLIQDVEIELIKRHWKNDEIVLSVYGSGLDSLQVVCVAD